MKKNDLLRFIRTKILKTRISSEELLENLRKKGARIGTDVMVYSTGKTLIDASSPWLLTIGDHVRIAEGVKILTHDYAWSVLKAGTGAVLGAQSPVDIGSNVFIGMNAIITRGVTIGDNVVIGAGSVVTRDCPSGGVYAGNPARRIMSIEEFFEKRLARQFPEARTIARRYRDRFGKEPPKEIFNEYFMLFTTAEEAAGVDAFRAQMGRMDGFETCVSYMNGRTPRFPDYETFLEACWQEEEA